MFGVTWSGSGMGSGPFGADGCQGLVWLRSWRLWRISRIAGIRRLMELLGTGHLVLRERAWVDRRGGLELSRERDEGLEAAVDGLPADLEGEGHFADGDVVDVDDLEGGSISTEVLWRQRATIPHEGMIARVRAFARNS